MYSLSNHRRGREEARRGREDRRVQRRPTEREREVELLRIGIAAETEEKLFRLNFKLHDPDHDQVQDQENNEYYVYLAPE